MAEASPRTAVNFPVQANAAEIMRYAAIRATEAGLTVCAPIHDAFLIEAPVAELEDVAARMDVIMGDASEAILGAGYRVKVDVEIAAKPEFYRDERGREGFDLLLGEIDRISADEGAQRLLKILREGKE
jgi:DNA polymerase I-like protein with 3'-5' exonuclease and polymerase domains